MNFVELVSEFSQSHYTSIGKIKSFEFAKSRLIDVIPFPGVEFVLGAGDGVSLPTWKRLVSSSS